MLLFTFRHVRPQYAYVWLMKLKRFTFVYSTNQTAIHHNLSSAENYLYYGTKRK